MWLTVSASARAPLTRPQFNSTAGQLLRIMQPCIWLHTLQLTISPSMQRTKVASGRHVCAMASSAHYDALAWQLDGPIP